MGKYELLPTEENLLTAIEEDMLYRNVDLGYFYRLLCSYIGKLKENQKKHYEDILNGLRSQYQHFTHQDQGKILF